MNYHKITETDCLSVASKDERVRLICITDFALLKKLAKRWCDKNNYKLGDYVGDVCWGSTEIELLNGLGKKMTEETQQEEG